MVEKLQILDQVLVPPGFDAFTRQKYAVLFPNALNETEVPRTPAVSSTVLENEANLETCKRYESARGVEFHRTVGEIERPLEPSAGEARTGVSGGAGNPGAVVKLQTVENKLTPQAFEALTRQ